MSDDDKSSPIDDDDMGADNPYPTDIYRVKYNHKSVLKKRIIDDENRGCTNIDDGPCLCCTHGYGDDEQKVELNIISFSGKIKDEYYENVVHICYCCGMQHIRDESYVVLDSIKVETITVSCSELRRLYPGLSTCPRFSKVNYIGAFKKPIQTMPPATGPAPDWGGIGAGLNDWRRL